MKNHTCYVFVDAVDKCRVWHRRRRRVETRIYTWTVVRGLRGKLHKSFTEWISMQFHWKSIDITKFNATPDLLDSINQWRAENLFHQNLFFNWAGQINQWPEQKSMKSFPTKIFFLFWPAESINQCRIISARQVGKSRDWEVVPLWGNWHFPKGDSSCVYPQPLKKTF